MNGAADGWNTLPRAHVGEEIVIAPAAGHLHGIARLDLEDEARVIFKIAPEGRREAERVNRKAKRAHFLGALCKARRSRLEALAMAHGAAGGECSIRIAFDAKIILDAPRLGAGQRTLGAIGRLVDEARGDFLDIATADQREICACKRCSTQVLARSRSASLTAST